MARTQIDALDAFSHLSDNVPTWINQVSDLVVHTTAKHAEFSAAFKKLAVVRSPRRRKNSSVCSIHTEKGTSDVLASGIPRKRGNEEVRSLSSNAGGASMVSFRNNLVIHYDGHTQETLEEIVRHIGTARNYLRRGKMSQMARPPAVLRFTVEADNNGGALGESGVDPLMASIRRTRNRGPAPSSAQNNNNTATNSTTTNSKGITKDSSFDFADKQLELAHGLCESAAHQFLRVGECSALLESVESKFTLLQEMAANEVERLKAERLKEQQEVAAATATTTSDMPAAPAAPASGKKPLARNEKAGTPGSAIEVDDDSSPSIESIDLAAFRASNRYRA
ncbi:hypothetical protein ASPZODRAFT_86491 [Penicilliopsis zonata CBS 506.65]|uniref:Uncharacterized protein n=1 Tax=Penicilliopsis zonata CBS 506.65 TaxID=1073090 RepID=A0A1L9SUP4_9EURO|nr:hypothetical protein ASPZODRAFT_86491 [Penicilliopsis zonata CBS 506.65]OJJ50834.1 hypothetical protein ASPZODRAFT_86491 [Penicilliopsis zonata CBS 506.65]